ncbi:UTP--glucose-1-phosphate uridylyltransferase [Leptospira sp. 2 VSF19]|uniref:UTP--glucose-1-phosphate uridylyltransferase n=1 Tax=Leptospira soteropolitanensis TaxID=2950025 RepID=A0AAW5VNF9_9LEPT|nr:UTP--glucose-1-phosphate uridylyltransferase [Leptospira soteropolitanensis]MCW7492410.1 UTP--glucose-1-phosphate uridylyltransferase [Leptospira soteropolitanensis]MCW7500462.1 UTP--glucose-1-phosphate uridylyltransferase [Leptospira soteropolitanensis]MCW7522868.1 UTP--glucose-1-phosphate uridylyltransferase [Leptospira soteropolitanensis]MCW7526727.1 UTP--glucose-1-phosphate uridylyltransferase [Leptospira soteropolitanensis]MCW7530432.1 UTP--glucose-1-phosphate uridylyltransferase [Lept
MDKQKSDQLIRDTMKSAGLSDAFILDFISKVDAVRNGETGIVKWEEVGDLDPNSDEISLESIHASYPTDLSLLSKLVVIKLNGGLGTSMGLDKAKSLIPIKDSMSFLTVMAKQIEFIRSEYGVNVPLLFMDSYNTQKDSQEELEKSGFKQTLRTSFLQNKVPRLDAETFTPIQNKNEKENWCPPGHGDIYFTMVEEGILDELLSKGYEIAFLSNGDNLGATVDPHIVSYLLKENIHFAMEMTPKTLADKKGGAIYRKTVGGKFIKYELLETAQVPKEHESEFSGLGKFRTFSTNNLWINLRALKERFNQGNFSLSLIVNPKQVDGKSVIQLETAMGSAVGNFSKFKGIIIPRDRFAPVKKTEDYLIRRSDAYVLNSDFSLTMTKERKTAGLGEILVQLDETYYKKIHQFDHLFQEYPSLVYCEELKVTGEILFDIPISVKGKVRFQNLSGGMKAISSLGKKTFENETVTL